ncbi:MAG: hypothetical protein ACLS61_03685 [Ruminococcus sp.]
MQLIWEAIIFFNDPDGQQGTHLTYDKYRGRFKKSCPGLEWITNLMTPDILFITKAKDVDMNEYILKMIVGHEIADITEKVYTHRTVEDLKREMEKITK